MRYLSEILLEEPRRGVLWTWHTTKKGLSGAGVSETLNNNNSNNNNNNNNNNNE